MRNRTLDFKKVKIIGQLKTEEALKDIEPIEYTKDVLEEKKKISFGTK